MRNLPAIDQEKLTELGIVEYVEPLHLYVLHAFQLGIMRKVANSDGYFLFVIQEIQNAITIGKPSKQAIKKAIETLEKFDFIKTQEHYSGINICFSNTSFIYLFGENHVQEKVQKSVRENKQKNVENTSIAETVISHLNLKTGGNYRTNSKTTIRLIFDRLNENYSQEDLILVIDDKVNKWLHKPETVEYLRPITLFSKDKFEGYLQTAKISLANMPKLEKIDVNTSEGKFLSYWKNTALEGIPVRDDLQRDYVWISAYKKLLDLGYGKEQITKAVTFAKQNSFWAEKLSSPENLLRQGKGGARIIDSILLAEKHSYNQTEQPQREYAERN